MEVKAGLETAYDSTAARRFPRAVKRIKDPLCFRTVTNRF